VAVSLSLFGVYKIVTNEEVQSAWTIRHKLWKTWTSSKEDRIAFYYTQLGDDIRDDFAYNAPQKREVDPDAPTSLWLNVGYWKEAQDYQTAGRDMALLMAEVT
jgi:hypothetical protein